MCTSTKKFGPKATLKGVSSQSKLPNAGGEEEDHMVTVSVGTGFSPHIRPRPKYPSLVFVLWHWGIYFVVQECLIGALCVYPLGPVYQWTRAMAKAYSIDDRLYFTLMTSLVHTGLYLLINLRKCKSIL